MRYFAIFLALIGMCGVTFAEEIPVYVQTPNDVDLVISGMVENLPKQDSRIIIIIEDEDGYPILIASASPDETGYFSLDVKRQGPLWENVIEFFVKARMSEPTSANATAFEHGVQNVGKIKWGEAAYAGFENTVGTVQVIDPDMNKFYNAIDFLRVKVWSDSSPSGTTLTLTETGMNTNIFEGDVIFSNKYHHSRGVVFVSNGDTVTATYQDMTLPQDMGLDVYKANATALIVGKRGPPMERAPASNLQILNSNNEQISDAIFMDQQIRLVSDLENQQNRTQPFAYLVQIQNDKNQVESLSWITGNLTSLQKLSPGVAWIPFKEGLYTATVFVWESIDNPTALSPPLSIELFVE